MTLPPLPKPDTHCFDSDERKDVWSHSPDQLRAYGIACAEAMKEECARVCESWGAWNKTANDCAAAIRALSAKEQA